MWSTLFRSFGSCAHVDDRVIGRSLNRLIRVSLTVSQVCFRWLGCSPIRLFAYLLVAPTKQTQELHQPSKSCIADRVLGVFSAIHKWCLCLVNRCSSHSIRLPTHNQTSLHHGVPDVMEEVVGDAAQHCHPSLLLDRYLL